MLLVQIYGPITGVVGVLPEFSVYEFKVSFMVNTGGCSPPLFGNLQIWNRERNIRDMCDAMNDVCKRDTEAFEGKPEI